MARKPSKRKKTTQSAPTSPDRRTTLRRLGLYAIGGAVVIGGGAAFAVDFQRKLGEHDLSVIGQGTPVVLQIHDPQCALCTELQRETRRALRSVPAGALLYRVADIRTDGGAARAALEGLPHVTLAFFDAAGRRVHVIQGVTPAAEIEAAFTEFLAIPTG
ncbi:MAG: hypothetical protein AAGF74_07805 [Pseudomonadota bacterium]